MKTNILSLIFISLLASFALLRATQAVVPSPDGGYPGGNTAEGHNALFSLTTGGYNTALGYFSLKSNTASSFNTAVGAGALLLNNADENTAVGAGALLSNTTGALNTANGAFALFSNTEGPSNTAVGNMALFNNTTGDRNTALGESAMIANTIGASNTAMGVSALRNNVTGSFNTAIGHDALAINSVSGNTAVGFRAAYGNTNGTSNTAVGYAALLANSTGYENTAVGAGTLQDNPNGNLNTAIGAGALPSNNNVGVTAVGWHAGATATGIGNVYIGAGIDGPPAGELGITRIANIYSTGAASGRAVYVTSDNILGTLKSSRRYKEEIKPIAAASEAILSLRPVSFRYKKEVDRTRPLCFGLIAEEVAEVSPDLVTPDRNGMPETVRYEAVNAMLLNEFLKEHREVQELKKEVAALAAGLQKVSAEVELGKPAPQVVNNP